MATDRFRCLASSVLETIRESCRLTPGVEHCGLLLADMASTTLDSCLAYPGPLRPREFRLPEEWLLRALLETRSGNRELVGFYHSHPPGEGLAPSFLDRSGHPPGSLVLLVGESEWRAYRSGDVWRQVPLSLLPV